MKVLTEHIQKLEDQLAKNSDSPALQPGLADLGFCKGAIPCCSVILANPEYILAAAVSPGSAGITC